MMKKIQKTTPFVDFLMSFLLSAMAFADDKNPFENSTAILPSDWGIEEILNLVLATLTAGAVVLATGSIVVAGFLYMTAQSNAGQVEKAKTMIFNTIIGVIAYIFMWAILEWLIPGGVF